MKAIKGSPPHGRGKEEVKALLHFNRGITPAWAGKSQSCAATMERWWDHPRMGGEKRGGMALRFPALGSPPHGRGKVGLDGGLSEAVGITPAQAGKSKLALCTPSCPTDHPRACGEKNKELEGVWLPMGSPPRGRGKDTRKCRKSWRWRITPAWAGKSISSSSGSDPCRDHPRMGGEKMNKRYEEGRKPGSPPRGRGKEVGPLFLTDVPWITPAWAGKSRNRKLCRRMRQDHPRMGGEKAPQGQRLNLILGSPPRGRGKGHLLAGW